MSFRLKLLLTFVLYGLSLVIFTQFVVYKLNEEQIKVGSLEKAGEILSKKEEQLQFYLKNTNLKLLALKESHFLKEYQSNENALSDLEALFLDIARTSDNIMQLRYLDKEGVERIRVDRDSYASTPFLVSTDKLQDKKNRYYFNHVMQSDRDSFWYSKLDLNVEYNEIEKPIKPVLRVGTPLEYRGEKSGVIIINIFMKDFLEQLVNNPFSNIYLIDKDGNTIVNSLHKNSWSQYLDKEKSSILFSEDNLDATHIISRNIPLNNGEEIHMIVEPKKEYIQSKLSDIIYESAFILLGVILLSFPLSYIFSRVPSRLKEEVDRQKERQDTLLSLFDLSDAVLFKWKNDEEWSTSFVSKSIEKLLGYSKEELLSKKITYSECVHPDDLSRVIQEVKDALKSGVYYFEHKPYRVITKTKEIKWILDSTVIVRDKENEIKSFVGYLTDFTEFKNHEFLLEKISKTDQLTQICNRVHLDELLQTQYHRFHRDDESLSIVMVDVDHFKDVNDNYGHLVGDKVLVEIATLLKNSIRKEDSVGRWGGEEFLIILPHTKLDQALLLAEKLRKIISRHDFIKVGHKTGSFGVASLSDRMSIDTLTENADKALYKAKESGRNCVCRL